MAIYSGLETRAIYEAAAQLRDRCLQENGSLLADGTELWTLANLERIHKMFVAAPDEGDRR